MRERKNKGGREEKRKEIKEGWWKEGERMGGREEGS